MSDQSKKLHDLIEQAREEDLPLLSELVARFQRPLDFATKPAPTALPQSRPAERRQDEILLAHLHARTTHLIWQHMARTAERLGIKPERIEMTAGGASIGANDAVQMTRHWRETSTFCRLNTFHVEDQEVITFDRSGVSNSGSELTYKVSVLTHIGESETSLNIPISHHE